MRTRLLRTMLAFAALSGVSSEGLSDTTHHNEPAGYSLVIPDGWVEIPKEALQVYLVNNLSPEAQEIIDYQAAFQPQGYEWFTLPYALVQVIPYAQQPTVKKMREIAASFGDVGFKEFLEKDLREDVAEWLNTDPEFRLSVFDSTNHAFVVTMEVEVLEVGPVKTIVYGYFGRRTSV